MTIHFLQPTVLELGSCVGRCMVAPAAEFKEVVVLCARTLKRTILLQPHRTQRVSGHFCSKTNGNHIRPDLSFYSYCKFRSIFKNSCTRSWTV